MNAARMQTAMMVAVKVKTGSTAFALIAAVRIVGKNQLCLKLRVIAIAIPVGTIGQRNRAVTMRREFSNKTKLEAWKRCGGVCEGCGLPIKGRPEYDHITPCGLGGDASLGNCACLCRQCHARKTHEPEGDRAKMSKADRVRLKHLGIIRPKGTIKSRGFR